MSNEKKIIEFRRKLGKKKEISVYLQTPKFIFDDNELERCHRGIEQQMDKNFYNY
jgi:hypothetical protein